MPSDEFIAQRKGRCDHLKEIGWERYYGTTSSGNLPQFKATSNPCGVNVSALNPKLVNDLNIKESSFRFYHISCPYAVESEVNEILDRNRWSPTFGQNVDVSNEATSHTVTSGIMIKFNRGSKYGWLCVDDACPYYQTTGQRYFYI